MGGFFGVVSKEDCMFDLFFGTDYHSHLGTKRGGICVLEENGFNRAIHNIGSSPFRTKFEEEIEEMEKNGTFELLPKKEVIGIKKEYEKLNKVLSGIRNMA